MKEKINFSKLFINLMFSVCMLFVLCAGFFLYPINFEISTNAANLSNENQELEEQPPIEEDYSIFIYEPIFSTFYNNKTYFVDKYDHYLKIHDIETNSFEKNPLSLSMYSEIISATSTNNFLFLLVVKDSKHIVICVDLNELAITELEHDDLNINENYDKISATILSDNEYAVTLTPNNVTSSTLPMILTATFDEEQDTIDLKVFTVDIMQTNQIQEELYGPLFKVLITKFNGTNYLLLMYSRNFVYCNISFDNSTIPVNSIISIQNQTGIDLSAPIANVNILTLNETPYLLITNIYEEDESTETIEKRITSKLYSFSIGSTATDYFNYENEEFKTNSNILTNGNYLIFSNKQNITYVSVEKKDDEYVREVSNSTNPDILIDYYDDSDFIYYTLNEETILLTSPWNYSEPICTLPVNSNIICVGNITIEGSNLAIFDYKYCMYTVEDKNYIGYVKTANLTAKNKVSVNIYGQITSEKPYPRVKTVANTTLYSLPTVNLGIIKRDASGVKLNSYAVEQIIYNSKVEVIDAICTYSFKNKSNADEIMLKVKVNDKNIGYITKSSLIDPSDINNFVITNSSIKGYTYVYLQESLTSPVIALLSDGYRVRINGTRNVKTGFTNITFNDEYGNEFSGYIKIDSVGSDSWSTLQIIGCVLITINIGLLVLILIFKHKNIGQNGQKYLKNKKENYKKNNQI